MNPSSNQIINISQQTELQPQEDPVSSSVVPVEKKKKKLVILNKKEKVCDSLQDTLSNEYTGQCKVDLDTKECNQFLLKKELANRICLADLDSSPREEFEDSFLYPQFDDPQFNIKIAEKKEFHDTRYDGEIHPDIKEYADKMSNAEFEIQPHQMFVRNFLSFQTPYNSLLLYHGLGSGKTYSAIGVCEEMREYLKNVGSNKRILIVASENVQNNFRNQMFDDRKLVLVNDRWTIKGYVANQLLREVNPMNLPGIPKERILSQVRSLINQSYLFLGYGQFANYIRNTMQNSRDEPVLRETREKRKGYYEDEEEIILSQVNKQRLRNEFQDRLIVIDEIHNIRKAEDAESKKVAIHLEILVKAVRNLRLLFLSATPMFNSYKEIIWLLNIMNMNDGRARVELKDIFEKNGEFKKEGRELFIQKATGYISFVRGENPYTFPYRVYPSLFAPDKTFPEIAYPLYQMNGKRIRDENRERILSLYLTYIGGDCSKGGNGSGCGMCQYCNYRYILYYLKNKSMNITTKKGKVREMRTFLDMTKFGYNLLQLPLASLIISYPSEKVKEAIKQMPEDRYSDEFAENIVELAEEVGSEDVEELGEDLTESIVEDTKQKGGQDTETPSQPMERFQFPLDPRELTGKKGLERMMNFTDKTTIPPEKGSFEYKKSTLDTYGRIFSPSVIGKYSAKIQNILNSIYKVDKPVIADGVILIYSQYIDAGLIPVALALEEMGFTRYGKDVKPLFKNRPTDVVDVRNMQAPEQGSKDFLPARYAMITGDVRLSPDNEYEVKGLTNDDNKDGHKVKIVLISRTGAEGIDFKFIRQIHILEPWYNMNRMEQIIGRGVRNSSHKALPFEKRNVEIFMYGTILGDNQEEAADLYVYRVAEYKAIQIGRITRVMKETAVDCILHHDQTNFTQEKIEEIMKKPVTQVLSNGEVIRDFKIGDLPYSSACDYMATCDYQCVPDATITESNINSNTYGEAFMNMNNEKIMEKIKRLMRERFFYVKKEFIALLQIPRPYPLVQIYAALTQMIEENEIIRDKYDRSGYLVNIGEYYFFQPLELIDKHISVFDRSVPIDYKHQMIRFDVKETLKSAKKESLRERKGQSQTLADVEEEAPVEMDADVEAEAEEGEISDVESVISILEDTKGGLLGKMKKQFDEIQESYLNYKQDERQRGKLGIGKGDEVGEKWYQNVSWIMVTLTKEYRISLEELNEFLVAHMIETLLVKERIELLNSIYFLKPNVERNSFEWFVKHYFMEHIFSIKNFHAYVANGVSGSQVWILNRGSKEWTLAEPEDVRDVERSKEGREKLNPLLNTENLNSIVGLIGYEKKNQYLVFKTRDLTAKRDLGARCDQAEKGKTVQLLNKVIGESRYTIENTKGVYQKEDLCILLEFLMRYNNREKKNGKVWILQF